MKKITIREFAEEICAIVDEHLHAIAEKHPRTIQAGHAGQLRYKIMMHAEKYKRR